MVCVKAIKVHALMWFGKQKQISHMILRMNLYFHAWGTRRTQQCYKWVIKFMQNYCNCTSFFVSCVIDIETKPHYNFCSQICMQEAFCVLLWGRMGWDLQMGSLKRPIYITLKRWSERVLLLTVIPRFVSAIVFSPKKFSTALVSSPIKFSKSMLSFCQIKWQMPKMQRYWSVFLSSLLSPYK